MASPCILVYPRVGDPRMGSGLNQTPSSLSYHRSQQAESRTQWQHPQQPSLKGAGAQGIPLGTQQGTHYHPFASPSIPSTTA